LTGFRLPALFVFTLDETGRLWFDDSLPAEGNVLDVAIMREEKSFLYSVDTVHRPYSMTEEDEDEDRPSVGIYGWSQRSRWWIRTDEDREVMTLISNHMKSRRYGPEQPESISGTWSELLYGIEHLRKRVYEE
jgi:hypothetical protein